MESDAAKSGRARGRDKRDTEKPHAEFGEVLRGLREIVGLTRRQLSDHSGVPYPVLANLETGRRRTSDNMIAKLAPALGGLLPGRMQLLRNGIESGAIRVSIEGAHRYASGQSEGLPDGMGVHAPDLVVDGMAVEFKSKRFEEPDGEQTGSYLLKLYELLANRSFSAQMDDPGEPADEVDLPPRIALLQQITSEIRPMDEEDLRRVSAFLEGMRAARTPLDTEQ